MPYCPELEGCQSEGGSIEEVITNIKEAVELYLETLSEEEIKRIFKQRNFYYCIRGSGCLSCRINTPRGRGHVI